LELVVVERRVEKAEMEVDMEMRMEMEVEIDMDMDMGMEEVMVMDSQDKEVKAVEVTTKTLDKLCHQVDRDNNNKVVSELGRVNNQAKNRVDNQVSN
jgi:hypothetical protein